MLLLILLSERPEQSGRYGFWPSFFDNTSMDEDLSEMTAIIFESQSK
jgi:hypothetical protein